MPVPSARARSYLYKMTVGQMTSTVTIERPAVPTFDSTTGMSTAHTSVVVWSGPARIYSTTGGMQLVGGGLAAIGQSTVSIPQDAPLPKVDDMVEVTASPDDPAMVGRRYRVIDVTEGGILSPSRQLTVTTQEGSPWTS